MSFFSKILQFFTNLFKPKAVEIPASPAPQTSPEPWAQPKSWFDDAFQYTVGNEGGYSNNPNDPGGPTKYGITIHDLSRYLGRPATAQEVKNLSIETAKIMCKKWYWDTLDLDKVVRRNIALSIFDIGYVCGIRIGATRAQSACVKCGIPLVVDGAIGPKSIAALNSVDPHRWEVEFEKLVESRFRGIAAANAKLRVFLRGWLNRAKRLLTLG